MRLLDNLNWWEICMLLRRGEMTDEEAVLARKLKAIKQGLRKPRGVHRDE